MGRPVTCTSASLDCSTTATVLAGWSYVATIDTHRATASYNLSVSAMSDRAVAAYVNDKGGTSRITLTTSQRGRRHRHGRYQHVRRYARSGSEWTLRWISSGWSGTRCSWCAPPFTSTFTPLTSVTTIHATAGLLSTRPPNIGVGLDVHRCCVLGPSSASSQVGRLVIVGMQQSGGRSRSSAPRTATASIRLVSPPQLGAVRTGLLSAADNYVGVSYSVMLGDPHGSVLHGRDGEYPTARNALPGLMVTDDDVPTGDAQ